MASWGKCDFSSLQRMADELDRAISEREVEGFIRDVLNEVGNRLLRKTKKRTPVGQYGTYTYTYKRGKKAGQTVERKLKAPDGHTGGQLRRNWQIGRVQKKGSIYEIEVFNNTEYAPFVENGHRVVVHGKTVGFKDGVFMLRISANEIERMFPLLLQKRSDELLLRIFGGG